MEICLSNEKPEYQPQGNLDFKIICLSLCGTFILVIEFMAVRGNAMNWSAKMTNYQRSNVPGILRKFATAPITCLAYILQTRLFVENGDSTGGDEFVFQKRNYPQPNSGES
ncbi:hypothetical protein DdX_14738 [Ditylenchus destructor]|uniref:Uncharacterized protein n=1 Tax=Ditylenchus destructor TaxID=166010 RepID=A0AAD4R1F8_9BILA|nr:hypothetical protein DdX_14738 [Ditylenchus destructor]